MDNIRIYFRETGCGCGGNPCGLGCGLITAFFGLSSSINAGIILTVR
jgi:hypothetical protein